MKNGNLKIFVLFILLVFFSLDLVNADPIDGNLVSLQILDKVTSRLENVEIIDPKFSDNINKKNNISKRIIRPSNEELQLHKKYLKSHLPKNYYN